MPDTPPPDDDAAVLALVAAFAPGAPEPRDVDADRPLAGPGGLGLDSVRRVELLLACEERLGVAIDAEALLADPALSARALAAAVRAARATR